MKTQQDYDTAAAVLRNRNAAQGAFSIQVAPQQEICYFNDTIHVAKFFATQNGKQKVWVAIERDYLPARSAGLPVLQPAEAQTYHLDQRAEHVDASRFSPPDFPETALWPPALGHDPFATFPTTPAALAPAPTALNREQIAPYAALPLDAAFGHQDFAPVPVLPQPPAAFRPEQLADFANLPAPPDDSVSPHFSHFSALPPSPAVYGPTQYKSFAVPPPPSTGLSSEQSALSAAFLPPPTAIEPLRVLSTPRPGEPRYKTSSPARAVTTPLSASRSVLRDPDSGVRVTSETPGAIHPFTYYWREPVDPQTGLGVPRGTPGCVSRRKYKQDKLVDPDTGAKATPQTANAIPYRLFHKQRPVYPSTGKLAPANTPGTISQRQYDIDRKAINRKRFDPDTGDEVSASSPTAITYFRLHKRKSVDPVTGQDVAINSAGAITRAEYISKTKNKTITP